MRTVYVAGVGSTTFGRHPDRSLRHLGWEACRDAIADAGIAPSALAAGYCGNALAPAIQGETSVGQNVFWEVGLAGLPVINVENACASGSTALHQGWMAVAGGFHDAVIVVGVEKAVMPKGMPLNVGAGEMETQLGDIFPGFFAMMAQRHALSFGTTREQMAKVAVKNRANGMLNPLVQFKKTVTVEEVLASPMIADPITLNSCCANADGAAAAILCDEATARRLGRAKVRIAASVLRSGDYDSERDLAIWDSEAKAARLAYALAGLGPEDLDLVELHDAFSICEIVHCEGLGLCKPGEGGRLLDEGATALGGRIPVNPSGGLLAKGHPIGASGVGQIAEIAWQLRGRAGPRQIAGARVGLAQMMGGAKERDARAIALHILVAD
ncbi:MAG: thiolase family protein [Alphaproteobacteria bacterium]|nr:thiolase family protein [Alphaproteobacteria bacterium]